MKNLTKLARWGAFLLLIVASAMPFFLVLFVLVRLEDVADQEIQVFDLPNTLTDVFTSHWHTLLVALGVVLVIAIWLRNVSNRLREREELLNRILETAADGIYTVDQQGRITYANPTTEAMFGLDRREITQRTFDDPTWKMTTALGEPFPEQEQPFVQVKQTGKPVYGIEQCIVRSDGKRVVASVNAAPLLDANGRFVGEVGTLTDITERKRTEAALRNVERRYRGLFGGTVVMNLVTRTGADGLPVVVDCNDSFARTLGYQRPEILGRPVSDFYTAESRKRLVEGGYESAIRGQLSAEERDLVTKDGGVINTLVSAVPDMDENGRTIGTQAVFMDITESKRAQQSLVEERMLLRTLLDHIPDSVYAKDTQSRFTMANAVVADHHGAASPEEIIGKTDLDFFPQELARQFSQDEQQVMRTGVPLVNRLEQKVDRLGKVRWVLSSKVPLRDGEGKIVGLVGIGRDITEDQQMQEALRKSEARHRTLLEAVPDAIWHVDRNGVLLDYKPAKDLFPQLPIDQYVGKRIDQITPLQAREQIVQQLVEAVESGASRTFEYQLSYNQAIYDREARVVPGGEDDALMIVRDITDRKRVDRLKNEFVSMVSHELRTPLTSIRGSLGLIAGGAAGKVSSQARLLVDIAYKNSERLIRLINDILDMDKIELGKLTLEFKPIELMPILDQAIQANRAYGHQFGVEFVLGKGVPGVQVNADADRLIQVVTNLLSNAAKYSPRGGQVEVDVSSHGSFVRVSVRDHGSGIPEEFQSRIFQKFAQADSSDTRQKGGTGLGLSICKSIVERLGGKIGFETAPDAGTTFYFDLPEWHDQAKSLQSVSPRKPRILICEDDQDTAMLLKLMLEQSGYAPEIAYDATEAKEMLLKNTYAGMTLDLVLPDEDGISLIRELRDHDKTRDLAIVVVSMKADKGRTELNGDAVQVIDWISKPIDGSRLLAAVKQAASCSVGRPARILHVDDDPDILHVVSVILENIAQVDRVTTLDLARQCLREKKYDLVILDLEMPDGSGLDLVPLLQEHGPSVPAIIFSVDEVKRETAEMVSATLVKSRTSNEKLVQTIQSLLHRVPA